MPAIVHKIVVRGADIALWAISLIGQLTKEAQESRNNDIKYYRKSHKRKISRSSGNEDVFNLLLFSSDPSM